MDILPMGPRAWLVGELDDPAAWALGLGDLALPGVIDVVPAAETVLVTFATEHGAAAAVDALHRVAPAVGDATVTRAVAIDVHYDGADLAAVAAATGLTVDAVVDLHAGVTYHAAFCGFSPGFAYLTGLPTALHLPRRDSPRTHVPAGSVAIARTYSAVYPRASPGGWHLLGTTDAVLFDTAAAEPAAIRPGDQVRFVPV